jgi:T4 RnlA family RNA ligase
MNKESWNPAYNLVMKIKQDYINTFGSFDTYHFETWLKKLNKVEYNNVFECLQLNQNENELLIRYGLAEMQAGMWEDPNSIYRECRSLVIDLYNDEIIVSPFRKFFNLDEVEENKLANIQKELANAKIVEYSDKKDGSMQSARWYNGEIKMYGSMALKSEDSWRLADGYSRLTDNHKQFIQEHKEYTIIFEYISLADAHVVKYKKEDEGLYLIGMRNVYTGQELTYAQLMELARTWNIPVITIENTTLEQILQDCRKFKSHEKEGWVINIDGHKIKLKCDSYVQLHHILDYLSSINVIIKSVADNTFDDLKSKVPDAYQQRVIDIANQVFLYIDNMKNHTEYYYNLAPKEDKKQFMIWIDNNVPTEFRKYVRNKYLGVELNFLKSHSNSYKKAKEIGIIIE